jgi:hypothetical protein
VEPKWYVSVGVAAALVLVFALGEMGIAIIGWVAVMGGIGYLIGNLMGRGVAGAVWGTLAGPFGWVVMGVLVAMSDPKKLNLPFQKCPECAERIKVGAKRCKHCGEKIRASP